VAVVATAGPGETVRRSAPLADTEADPLVPPLQETLLPLQVAAKAEGWVTV